MSKDTEKIFREAFENFEAEVPSNVWANVNAQMQAPAGDAGISSAVGGNTTGILAKITAWGWAGIGATVITGVTFVVLLNAPANESQPTISENAKEQVFENRDDMLISGDQKAFSNQKERVEVVFKKPGEENTSVEIPSVYNEPKKQVDNSLLHRGNTESIGKTTGEKQMTSQAAEPYNTMDESGEELSTFKVVGEADIEFPVASIVASPVGGTAPLKVTFSSYAENTNLELQWDFGDGSTVAVGKEIAHVFEQQGTYTVTLTATNQLGVSSMETAIVEVLQLEDELQLPVSSIQMPNVFSPNNDGVNDVFLPQTEKIENYSLTVYSRTGSVVFVSDRVQDGWDGYDQKGQLAPEGTYFYLVIATGSDGRKYAPKGYFQLIR